jgi:hypothetical protein
LSVQFGDTQLNRALADARSSRVDRQLADALACVEQEPHARRPRQCADDLHRLHRPAIGGDDRQRDQPHAPVRQHGLQRVHRNLPGGVIGNDAHLDAALPLQLQIGDVVAGVFGGGGQDHVAGPQRQRIEGHVPRTRGVFHHGNFFRPRVEQPGDGGIDVFQAVAGRGSGFVTPQHRLALQVPDDGVEHHARHQAGAGVVEVDQLIGARRVGAQLDKVEHGYLDG